MLRIAWFQKMAFFGLKYKVTRQNSLKKRMKFTNLSYKGRSFWLFNEGFPFFPPNWTHPDVFSLKHSKSRFSQNTNNFIFNYKCGDMFRLIQSSSGQFLFHILGTSSKSAHFFWDPKLFTTVREGGYK